MPKKIRELKAMPRRAGFVMRPGKGSHTDWRHPRVAGTEVTLAGSDGDDTRRYLEDEVCKAIERSKGQP